jgi:hypothetical protein
MSILQWCKGHRCGSELLGDKDAGLYRSVTGSLMYLANCTRPDLALAVGCLARHMAASTSKHMVAAKRDLCYLHGTVGLGLVYGGNGLAPRRLSTL